VGGGGEGHDETNYNLWQNIVCTCLKCALNEITVLCMCSCLCACVFVRSFVSSLELSD